MLNVYEFIDSEEARDYLRDIDYSFTPAECAYIVGISRVADFGMKRLAYEEIINTAPDCRVGGGSLHEFLRERIKDSEDPVSDVFKSEEFEGFFSSLPLRFPLPFNKGDILVDATDKLSEPFVFSGEYENYDSTDHFPLSGYVTGYNYEDFGAIMTSFHRPFDCKRYTFKQHKYAFPRDEKTDATLLLLAAYMKGEIDKEGFAEQYKLLALKIAEAELDEFFRG